MSNHPSIYKPPPALPPRALYFSILPSPAPSLPPSLPPSSLGPSLFLFWQDDGDGLDRKAKQLVLDSAFASMINVRHHSWWGLEKGAECVSRVVHCFRPPKISLCCRVWWG